MDYLVRFAQIHESFRIPELQALADLSGIDVGFADYSQYVRHLSLKHPFQTGYLDRIIALLAPEPR